MGGSQLGGTQHTANEKRRECQGARHSMSLLGEYYHQEVLIIDPCVVMSLPQLGIPFHLKFYFFRLHFLHAVCTRLEKAARLKEGRNNTSANPALPNLHAHRAYERLCYF